MASLFVYGECIQNITLRKESHCPWRICRIGHLHIIFLKLSNMKLKTLMLSPTIRFSIFFMPYCCAAAKSA